MLRQVRRFRLRRIGVSAAAESPPPSSVQGHAAALGLVPFRRRRRAAAARRRRGRQEHQQVALRGAAQPNRNRNSRARAGTRRSNRRKKMGISRSTRRVRARCTPPATSQPPPTPRPIPPRAAGADGCAYGGRRRRSPIQRAGRRRSTRTVTGALAARLVVHYCTRGSKCRARRARAAASIGSARARSAAPRTARGDRHAAHAHARATQRCASSPFRPLSRRIEFGVAGRAAASGV